MKIAIDFGTNYTKIAFPDENGNPKLFNYPNESNGPYIPSEVLYGNGTAYYIGPSVESHLHDGVHTKFIRDLKTSLSLPTDKLPKWEKDHGKSPLEVVHDFFDSLLITGQPAFENTKGKIDELLVSVPEDWFRNEDNPGPDRLRNVFETLKFAKEKIQLQSEPVCAAAYYVYGERQGMADKAIQNTAAPYNLLVCDLGGGTFDIALCQVVPDCVYVLRNESSDGMSLGQAGAEFNRRCVQAACLGASFPIPENQKHFDQLARDFERAKLNNQNEDVLNRIEDYHSSPMLSDTSVYSFYDNRRRSFQVTADQAWNAFLTIREEIQKVLGRIMAYCTKANLSIDRVVIVGGFGQFPPVQKSIFDCLPGVDPNIGAAWLARNDRYCAIVKGAFYIIHNMVKVVEVYPHTLGLLAKHYVDGIYRQKDEIAIILAKQEQVGMSAPKFALDEEGKRVSVEINQQRGLSLPIFALRDGNRPVHMLKAQKLTNWPQPGSYYIGFHVNRSRRATLFFENCANHELIFRYSVDELPWELQEGISDGK